MDPTPTSIFGYPVHHEIIGGTAKLGSPVNGVIHTTETAGPVAKYPGDAPNAEISLQSGIRLFQPLDHWGSALRHSSSAPYSPNGYCVQVEIVGYSHTYLWHLDPKLQDMVAAFLAYCSQMHGFPLSVPNPNWRDDGSDCPLPWAANNSRRQWAAQRSGSMYRYPVNRGVWMHMEVPWQDPTWHWDCGAITRRDILANAQSFLTPPKEDDLTPAESAELHATHNLLGGLASKLGLPTSTTIGGDPAGNADVKAGQGIGAALLALGGQALQDALKPYKA